MVISGASGVSGVSGVSVTAARNLEEMAAESKGLAFDWHRPCCRNPEGLGSPKPLSVWRDDRGTTARVLPVAPCRGYRRSGRLFSPLQRLLVDPPVARRRADRVPGGAPGRSRRHRAAGG